MMMNHTAPRYQVDQGTVRWASGGAAAGPEELPGQTGVGHHPRQHCSHWEPPWKSRPGAWPSHRQEPHQAWTVSVKCQVNVLDSSKSVSVYAAWHNVFISLTSIHSQSCQDWGPWDWIQLGIPTDLAHQAGQPSLQARVAGAVYTHQLHCHTRWFGGPVAGRSGQSRASGSRRTQGILVTWWHIGSAWVLYTGFSGSIPEWRFVSTHNFFKRIDRHTLLSSGISVFPCVGVGFLYS